MKLAKYAIILIASVGLLSAGCASGGTAATNDDYLDMSKQVAQLEGANPGTNPKVSLQLKRANDQLAQAKNALQKEEYELVDQYLKRARGEAQLAEALMERDQNIDAVLAVYRDIDEVRLDMNVE